MTRTIVVLTATYGFLGVAIGAFGAHAARSRLPEDRLEHIHTAVRYLFASLPGLLLVALLSLDCEGGLFESIAAWSFGVGIAVFSGSLVVLALTGNRRWGAATPLGGVLLLVGWASVIAGALLSSDVLPSGASNFYVMC